MSRFVVGFPTGRDSTTFRDNGKEVSSLSRDKGTTGQAQNLAKGRDGPGQLKSGTGRVRTAKIRDGTRDKTGQSRKGCSKTGNGCSKTGKDVLKQENDVLKQEIWSSSCFGTSFSCFLCSFGKVVLSREVPGQRGLSRDICSCPCPGTKGQRDVPSRGNPIVYPHFFVVYPCGKQ